MSEGWVRLYRQLITNGWLKNHKLCIFWIYCLLKATHEPFTAKVGYQEVNLEPGQFIFGRRVASQETGLSEQEIRTSIDSLKKSKNLTIKSTNKFSIISIVNWSTYQNGEIQNNQQPNQQLTNKQPHTRTKEQKNIYLRDSKKPNPAVKEFIDFWYSSFIQKFEEPYPVNGGKEGALVKDLLKTYSLDRLKELAESFFKSSDHFILNSGYTIGAFKSVITKLACKNPAPAVKAHQPSILEKIIMAESQADGEDHGNPA